jgi:CheY-like chemotaxis protein/DNA-binding MarR family transcriptional regulator
MNLNAALPEETNDLKGSVPSDTQVLVVEDDPATLTAYGELLSGLGYEPILASSVLAALQILSQKPSIGIILTDLHLPVMGGLDLLEEVTCRFALRRPIEMIVATGYGSLETAVKAMRLRASDFLTKPVSTADLTAALRRASRSISEQSFRPKPRSEDQPQPIAGDTPTNRADRSAPTDEDLLTVLRSLKRTSDQRSEFFDQSIFGDPCWDILLELTAARIQGQPVPVSSACNATHLPFSTALRYVRQLVDLGLIKRWRDPNDRRRDLLDVDDATFESMKTLVGNMRRKIVENG